MLRFRTRPPVIRGALFALPVGLACWALLYWLWPVAARYLMVASVAACILIAIHGAIQARLGPGTGDTDD